MLKIIVEQWDKNKDILKEKLKEINLNDIDYKTLVKMTFKYVYNTNNEDESVDVGSIHQIDDGDYQGTLLYLIPFDTYQPSEYEYLMTHIRYGSCSGCDTLLGITEDYEEDENEDGVPSESQLKDLMILCKDILQNTIKPYNDGWREYDKFKQVEVEDEK